MHRSDLIDIFKQKELVIRDRGFKVGDVFRSVGSPFEIEESRGFGIVIETNGPYFKAYWTGDSEIRSHDVRLDRTAFILQDYAPMPEVAEVLNESR